MQDLEQIQSKRLQRKLDRQKALQEMAQSPPPLPAPEPRRAIKRVASKKLLLGDLDITNPLKIKIHSQNTAREQNLSVTDKPDVELPQASKIIQKIIPESELLLLIKPKIPQNLQYKKFYRQFQHLINRNHLFNAQRINAINQIINSTTLKFKESILIIVSRLIVLKSQNMEINKQMIKQRQNQLLLTIIKSNFKIQRLKKKLINALNISNIEIQYANVFLLLRHIYKINQIKTIQNRGSSNIFYQWKNTVSNNLNNNEIAVQICNGKYMQFLFNFMYLAFNEKQIENCADNFYIQQLLCLNFTHLKNKINRKMMLRTKLLGSTLNNKTDIKFIESANSHPIEDQDFYRDINYYKGLYTQYQTKLFSFFIPLTNKFKFSQIILHSQKYPNSISNLLVQSRLSIFQVPAVKISQTTNKIDTKLVQFNTKQYLQQIKEHKLLLSCSNKLFYINHERSILDLENLPSDLQRQIERSDIQDAVTIRSKLYITAQCFHNWYSKHLKQQYYIRIETDYSQRNLLKRYISRFGKATQVQKLCSQNIISTFQTTIICQKYFKTLFQLSKQLLTTTQQVKADRFFKLIIMRRQIQHWKRLIDAEKRRNSNFTVIISLLQEITLVKPFYLNWNALTTIFRESREKGNLLSHRIAGKVQRTTFEALSTELRKRKLLKKLFAKAAQNWWKQEFYEQNQLPKIALLSLSNAVQAENSVLKTTKSYEQKLRFRAFKALKQSFYEASLIASYQFDFESKKLAKTFQFVRQKSQKLQKAKFIQERKTQFNFALNVFFEWKNRTFLAQKIANPIILAQILQNWRNHLTLIRIVEVKYNKFSIIHSLKKWKKLYRISLVSDIIMNKQDFDLKAKCLNLMNQKVKEQRSFKQNNLLNSLEIADNFYLNSLRNWAGGKRDLVADQRLWQGRKFVFSFQTEGDLQEIQHELLQYLQVHRLQYQFKAFVAWYSKVE
ncbi:hypothetical protein SS50377_22450 [Spironucleus salmonicida]|uniref:Uncharacterized protein n=1 Tax=Spironucleus salmonicida TaxID=348837 RepID=V6LMW5_9EUKA|nr:hypothetical protein SS50377_22450 [Spironucleus salmonicida]|eukprot:EST42059.1 hypothetical protein SS50377_18366 [Spironucleus salmonicida]